MALQSEVSPPMVGDPNKDTQIEGDTKSDDEESSQSTDEDVDLEEGEILDSGEEAEEEKKDLTNSSLQEALDKEFLKDIEQLVSQAKAELPATNIINKNLSPHSSPHKKKKSSKYLDHDKFEDNSDHDDGWYSPSRKHKSSKYDAKPIDYRKELEAYRGTPPSSPDSKHREKKKKRSSKKSKKSSKKTIRRKDIKGEKVRKFIKEANKFRICKFFKEGNCAKGADCGFSHATPKSFKKKELCKFYLSGHCNKGSDCAYMHGEFPCKFYHTGSECYAKDNCRFSHAPLTEETQRILDDYLHINRGEDERMDLRDRIERKRRNSPSPSPEPMPPPPSKRICLLGSPPRHIREAEETKRWQEEMLMQQQNHPSFKIHISPSRDCSTPPPYSRPNFYQETLPDTPSPKKIRLNAEVNPHNMNFPPASSASGYPMSKIEPSVPSPDDNFIYEEDYLDMEDEVPNIKQEPLDVPDFNWTDMHTEEHNMPTIKKETFDTNQPDLDFTNDVKFDETTQFSEMESSIDCNVSSPPSSFETPAIKKEIVEDSDNDTFNHELNDKPEEKITDDMSPVQEPVPPPPPIMIPSHLPKKQQELFKRIFQHQKKTEMAASASDASNSPKSYDNAEPEIKEIEDTDEKTKDKSEKSKPSVWSSSEDDDDDDDSVEPLTDVLKKLQKEPPVSNVTNKVESKPAASLMAMLNKIQQNTLQKNRSVQETQQSDFFKNLLHGNISSNDSIQLPGLNMFSEPKRRALLPDPEPVIKKEPVDAPKDPRLKNRDPRTLASSVSHINLPKTLEQTPLQTSSSLISSTAKTTILSTSSVITESTIDVPYKLRGIYTKPPNYTPYINATQSNPNLLKDPRLRKHLNLQNNENGMETKREVDSLKSLSKDVPPIPKLLLEYDKHSLNINIFESNPVPKPISEENQDIKPIFPKISDPRMCRRDSQNSSGSNTPPHLSIENSVSPPNKTLNSFENVKIKEEKMWSPPVLEKAWLPPVLEPSVTIKQEVDSDTDDPCRLEIDESPQNSSSKFDDDSPPVLTKKAIPSPASHLPRAIADPRMARLHNPLDSRRLRVGSSDSSNKTVELSKVSPKQNSPPKEILLDASKASTVVAEDDSNCTKVLKSIPKKKSEKSEEKKKTVHRNRKSSMDYASPLNSCDDSNSNKGLNYNSYNQRQPRTSASHISSDSNNSTNLVIPETSSDFLSDNSNLECDNSSDVNLKDMFKTIDPTASPFC